MRLPAIYSGLAAVGFSAVALTACGGGMTPGATAMAPGASVVQPAKKTKSELLYVADVGDNAIDVYTYPKGTSVQMLLGFVVPFGVCTDKKGNVFATDNYSEDILEYAHGGSTPMATLFDENHNPAGCAVNKKTGDLAVVHESSTTNGTGGVTIYKNATSLTNFYSGPTGFAGWFCAYDKKGNLFIDGIGGSPQATVLLELPKGGSSLEEISLPVAPYGPGGLASDGKYLLIADEQSNVYELSISGTKATKKAEIKLQDGNSLYGFVLNGKDLVGAESNGKAVGVWKFPAGGKPIQTITGPATPLDAAISK